LAVLFIVFYKHGNLAEICRDFPDVRKHMEYNPDAKFSEDITNLLPPHEKHWWEMLGESSPPFSPSFLTCSTVAEAQQRQEVPRVSVTLPKVQLILPAQPKESAESPEVVIEEMDDEVDELEDNNYVQVCHTDIVLFFRISLFSQPSESMCASTSRLASNSAAKTKKQKGTSFLEPTAAKQHAGPLWWQASSTLHPEPSGPSTGRAGYKFEVSDWLPYCLTTDHT
jgi:hypothetical protein